MRASKHQTRKPSVHDETASKKGAARGKTARSNLIDELVQARKAAFRSVLNLAAMAGVAPSAIRKLENGEGRVATLVAVMEALPFQVNGIAPGRTFAEQLQNCRVKKDLSIETVAAKAALSPQKVVRLEQGGGSVQSLLALLAVIAPRVRHRAPERAHWGLSKKAARDSRFTPHSFMAPIYASFGTVDLDPCAHRASPVIADRRFFLEDGDDGLVRPWSGRLVFINPPFSQQLKWLRRAHEQWEAGNVETVVCLVPGRTDSDFFHDTIRTAADIFFLRGRVPFSDEAGNSQVTPFSLMVVVFGATAAQKARFMAQRSGFWVSADAEPEKPISSNIRKLVKSGAHEVVFTDCRARIDDRRQVRCFAQG